MEPSKNHVVTTNIKYPWHDNSWKYFAQARESNHLPHAIILSGEKGIGKLALANKMAKSLLCMRANMQSGRYEACGACQSCKTYESGANPDYTSISLLEGKQQIGVDQIRELSEFLNYSRSFNTYRVVLLNPVERMNKNAANSLLKSLEEPASNTVIILIASQLSNILPTIKSRCQLLSLPTPTKNQSLAWLKIYSPDLVNPEQLLQMAFGKPLLAIDINFEDIESSERLATDLLAVISDRKLVVETAKNWEKYDLNTLLDWQIFWIQEMIKQAECRQTDSNENTEKYTQTQFKLSELISNEQKWILYQQLINQKHYIHTSVNTLMFVENMIMLWLKAK